MPPPAGAKICIRCKQDCSTRPRTKDAQGRYLCRACQEGAAAKPELDPIPIADEPLPVALLEEPAPVALGLQKCPSCGSSIPHGGALCVQCGFDVRKGAQLATEQGAVKEESPRPPRQGKCGKCGYSLKGLKEPRCPECGTVVGKLTDREKRNIESAKAAKWAYLKPVIHMAVGFGVAAVVCISMGRPEGLIVYGVRYLIEMPIGILVFVACCFAWVGFDTSLHLVLLRLAGLWAIMGVVSMLSGLIPIWIVPLAMWVLAYAGLLADSMEVDVQDGIIIAVLTLGAKFIIGISVIAWLIDHGYLDG